MFYSQAHAEPATITTTNRGLDGYARKGVAITRDAASVVTAALARDSYELRRRGGAANIEAAELQDKLRRAMMEALR